MAHGLILVDVDVLWRGTLTEIQLFCHSSLHNHLVSMVKVQSNSSGNDPIKVVCGAAYLGADEVSFTMNFSKGGSMIIAQYYQFLRLGFSGYKRIMQNLESVAERLRKGILETGTALLLFSFDWTHSILR